MLDTINEAVLAVGALCIVLIINVMAKRSRFSKRELEILASICRQYLNQHYPNALKELGEYDFFFKHKKDGIQGLIESSKGNVILKLKQAPRIEFDYYVQDIADDQIAEFKRQTNNDI